MLMGFSEIFLSHDAGETWVNPGNDPLHLGGGAAIALDENKFYRTNLHKITRSTDGGFTWHPFMTGVANSDIQNLSTIKNVLYAVTGGKIVTSRNRGESWETLNVESEGEPLIYPKIQATDEVLYVSSIPGIGPNFFTSLLAVMP